MKSVVIPFSGGMDSTVLVNKALSDESIDKVYTLFFDYSQRHFEQEVKCVKTQIPLLCLKYGSQKLNHQQIDVKFIRKLCPTSSLTNDDIATPNVRTMRGEAQPLSYVPNRNMIFLSIATAYAESVGALEVWHGAAMIDSLAGYWDGSKEFLEKINEVNSLNRDKKIQVVAPLLNLSKMSIIKLGAKLGVNFAHTYTCYSGEEKPDVNSPSSSLRIRGFIDAGYIDPLEYQQDLSEVWLKHNCKAIETYFPTDKHV